MEIRYYSTDGQVFADADTCKKHEAEVETKRRAEEEKKAKREDRWNEVLEAYNRANKLYDAFAKDYGASYSTDVGDLFHTIFTTI
jgi:hypothetical protein